MSLGRFNFLKRKKFWKRLVIFTFLIPILLFVVLITIVYYKQDTIVKELVATLNEDFEGTISIKDSHIAPFANFPYISIDIEGLEVFEFDQSIAAERIVSVQDVYVGFDIMGLISGKYDVKSIKLSKGDIRIVQHTDGTLNIVNAFKTKKEIESVEEEFHLDLKSIVLKDIDISKLNETNGVLIDVLVTDGKTSFKTTNDHLAIGLDSRFQISLVKDGDSTSIKHKHFEVDTEIDFNHLNQLLTISPTEVILEGASFNFEGKLELAKDVDLDLHFSGKKKDFNLFLAMAPEELVPVLKQFENKGDIFFDATIKGKSANGHQPAINARFGCSNGYFHNVESEKKLEEIGFKGSFTNGKERTISSMRFELENFTAKPEAGTFKGKLIVANFLSPEIDMNLVSDFDLDYLAKFLNLKELKGLSGRVLLTMNFKDIIDLNNPEKSLEHLNQSYKSELEIRKLKFKSSLFHLPLENLDLKAEMIGNQAKIDHLQLKVGKSDVSINGFISDLPAIIHHTSTPVTTNLNIRSGYLDIHELTAVDKTKKPVDEQIENLSLKLKFVSSAKAITESPNLPVGEFFIDDFYAKMKHYPHTLHDFHADVFVDENDFRVVDFSGIIDDSDFHFSGRLDNYPIWFEDKIQGDTRVEFDFTSNVMRLDNVFTYGGDRFVPEDYRHEVVSGLKLHGVTDLHFKDGHLTSTDFQLSQFQGKMKVHPLKFEQFSGRVHLEKEFIKVKQLKGKMGRSSFAVDFDYNLTDNQKVKNRLTIESPRLDFDELMNYNLHPTEKTATASTAVDHDNVFSIYDFDFPEIEIKASITELDYHKYILRNVKADIKSESNHFIRINKLAMNTAGGHFDISGYLNGKDKKHIYLNPEIKVTGVDLDKLMVKFDNFGQDQLLSENLHGKFTGTITGKIHLHADLVPKIDDSELSIEMQVLNGKLEKFGPILALSNYFEDSKLKSVVFDTLQNTFTLKNGNISIPAMTINSNLGFLEIRGNQKISGKMDMNYLVGVPWKLISQVAGKKLFKRSKGDGTDPEEIQYRQENSKFLYIKMEGDLENYKIGLSKKPK